MFQSLVAPCSLFSEGSVCLPFSDTAVSGKQGTGVFSGYYIYSCGGLQSGDFSCLFRALAHQLNRPFSDAEQIRQEVLQHLRENSSSFPELVSLLLSVTPDCAVFATIIRIGIGFPVFQKDCLKRSHLARAERFNLG